MRFFDYVFYCHYLLFDWLRKGDYPETKAAVMMTSSNYCLLLALLFASGYFFRVPAGVAVAGCVPMLFAYYRYFIRQGTYKALVKRFAASRSQQQARDRLFATAWTLFKYFAIILYVWLRYE